jgi:uncharacterized lipoprotein YddW (UPF0748 family)
MDMLSRRRLLQMVPAVLAAKAAAETLPAVQTVPRPAPLGLTHAGGEDRGIWIHPERSLTTRDAQQGRAQVRTMVSRYVDAGFNLLLPWTVSGYLAAVDEPRLRDAHPSASWDALQVLAEEADAQKINVDIWYSFTEYRGPKSPEFDPVYGGDPAWRAIHNEKFKSGKDEADGAWNVCAQHAPARRWQLDLLERALKRYPTVRGLQIEEPGYDSGEYCLCALCRKLFEEIHGLPLEEHLQTQQAQDLKTIGNSAFVWELREYLRAKHPQMMYTINGGCDWRRDRRRGRDWGRWALSGWMDAFIPQAYEENVEAFRRNLHLTIDDLGRACAIQAGIALAWSEGKNDIEMVIRQIDAAREIGSKGILLFHGAAFSDDDLKKLAKGPFRS